MQRHPGLCRVRDADDWDSLCPMSKKLDSLAEHELGSWYAVRVEKDGLPLTLDYVVLCSTRTAFPLRCWWARARADGDGHLHVACTGGFDFLSSGMLAKLCLELSSATTKNVCVCSV